MKSHLTGALVILAIQLFLAGVVFRFVPTTAFIAPVARVLDNLAPWFLGLALLMSVLTVAAGSRRTGIVLASLSLAGGLHLYIDHRSVSLPALSRETPDMRIVFFNALGDNSASGPKILSAISSLDPDVWAIAERAAMEPVLGEIKETYPFVSPCEEDGCALLVASKVNPRRFWQLNLNDSWEKRYAVAEIEIAEGKSVFIAASQIAKPWLSGISEPEIARLTAQYSWFDGPVVAVGDFNATPWSFPLWRLLQGTKMRALRRPPSTWPSNAGRFGLPIDQVLVGGGARVVHVRTFGDDLGSNHLGVVADIMVP